MIPIGEKCVSLKLNQYVRITIYWDGHTEFHFYDAYDRWVEGRALPHDRVLALLDAVQIGEFPISTAGTDTPNAWIVIHDPDRATIHTRVRETDVSTQELIAFLESQRDTIEMNMAEVTT
jgi:hypothetical protein